MQFHGLLLFRGGRGTFRSRRRPDKNNSCKNQGEEQEKEMTISGGVRVYFQGGSPYGLY
jgi:hypothetical protein